MDSRLSDAAWNGNVVSLHDLIEEVRIHNAALTRGETPLHIACFAGHLSFVEAIMWLRPDFARELSPTDGFSPLHIASARGYTEIVRFLLLTDPSLCLVKGEKDRIPLHCAVIKDRHEVVRVLIAANIDSIGHVTAQRETVLHLAVKNSQFIVFQELVEHLKQLNKLLVLNAQDDQGNTFLHLAASRKQYQVINYVLNEEVITKGTMELNSQNIRGLTPLDILTLSPSKAGDQELEDLLRQAGAIQHSSPNGQPRPCLTTWISRLIHFFMYPKIEDTPGELINFLLVVAILVVTATYQAMLSPPGGVWQDDRKGVLAAGQVPHTAGKAVMATKNPIGFKIFVIFNTTGFYICVSLIYFLTSKFPMRFELLMSMFALCFTYGATLSTIAPDSLWDYIFFHFWIASLVVIWLLIKVHWGRLSRKRNALP